MNPHVLIFPLPLQGTINGKLKLAELFSLAGFHVTFVNTHHMHRRLIRHTNIEARFSHYPNFTFETISDGLPEDQERPIEGFMEMILSMEAVTQPLFKEYLASRGGWRSKSSSPITCVVADDIFSWVVDVTQEIGIPLICFDTISPCAIWTYMCLPKLIENGELPFKGNDLDARITSVPGMESFLRRRDLPDFFRGDNLFDPSIQTYVNQIRKLPSAQGLIVNTFEELDGPILAQIRTVCPNLYSIGPLHAHFKSRLQKSKDSLLSKSSTSFSNSLWKEDRSSLTWLDKQPSRSVVYVSFGSNASLTSDQYLEFWHGLMASEKRFLWVIRPGSVTGWEEVELYKTPTDTKERGFIVRWTPQEEVLAHEAIGGFLTHSGWNSTLESIVEGVPMICWPHYVDQQVSSRFVSEVWKLGMDMKDTCDRVIISDMVKDLMEVRADEFKQSANEMARLARESISEGGSSQCYLNRLIEDIRLMCQIQAQPRELK